MVVYTVPALDRVEEEMEDEDEDEFRYTTSALGLGVGKPVEACVTRPEVVVFW